MRAAIALVFLAACSAGEFGQSSDRYLIFSPDENGLAVVPVGQRIDFGRAPGGVVSTLVRALGVGRRLDLDGCPPEIKARWQWGALKLAFSQEQFVGWERDGLSAGVACSS